jgi:crotonobetainyl-CoA:carnitine CoA-transferase CaiB-like acyl-CoA transferase
VIERSRTIAGAFAGKLLADLGASVLLVEPPQGHPLRGRPRPGPSGGLDAPAPLFEFLNGSKTWLREEHAAPLVGDIHILEAEQALTAAELGTVPHGSVLLAITPWGLTGPWAATSRPWTEFTLQAESGSLSARGTPGREPVMAGGSQPLWVAGCAGAAAALAATRTGRGTVIDLSLLDATTYTTNLFADAAAAIRGDVRTPETPLPPRQRLLPSVEQAADGWVGFNLASAQNLQDFLILIERFDWLISEEMLTHEARYARAAEFSAAVTAWTSTRTVREIIERAREFRIPVAPVHSGQTVTEDAQQVARRFFIDSPGGRFRHPAVPVLIDGRRPSPPRGPEGIPLGRSVTRSPATPPPTGPALPGDPVAAEATMPLAGLRVIELTTWWVGPLIGTFLGSLGADVIKVESPGHVDGARMVGGTVSTADQWWERSPYVLGINHNKRGITLDITRPEGRSALVGLLARADVLVENFAPRVMERAGLDWDSVHAVNPRLVMVRLPAFGSTGPMAAMTGFAQTVEQYSGLCWATGYSDGPPLNPGGPPDPMAGFNAVVGLLAALRLRDRTGRGHLVESVLSEAALTMTAEQVIEWTAAGTLIERDGNRTPGCAPQGVFACRGEERWLALSISSDEQWRALRGFCGIGRWHTDASLEAQTGRAAQQGELEKELGEWTSTRDVDDLVPQLLHRGIPAARVADKRFVHDHEQMRARGFFETINHPVAGSITVPVLPFRWSGHEHWSRTPAPLVGQHNDEILAGELGLKPEQLAAMAHEHIIGTRPDGL